MADNISFDTKGIAELRKTFQRLPFRVADKALKTALRGGARPMLKRAKSLVPVRTGTLRKALYTKVKVYPRDGAGFAGIGARSRKVAVASHFGGQSHGKTIYANPAKYLHLVEGGNYGGQGANPFMKRSFQSGFEASKQNFTKFLKRGVEREARKLGFK